MALTFNPPHSPTTFPPTTTPHSTYPPAPPPHRPPVSICIQLSLISRTLQNVLFEKHAKKKKKVARSSAAFCPTVFFHALLLDLHLHIEGAAAGCAENPARSLRVLAVGCKLFKADWVCSARRQVDPPPPPPHSLTHHPDSEQRIMGISAVA